MKKFLAMVLALAMLLSLAACGDKKPPEETVPQTQTQPTEDPNLPSYTFTQYGNAKITVVGAEFIKNDWDEDVLRVYYNYTNTGNRACGTSPSTALEIASIKQDGKDCDRVHFGTDDDCAIPEDLLEDSNTQPGCTSRQTLLIKCDPNGGIVDVSCYIMIGSWMYNPDETQCFNFQIDPKNLMGAPAPLELPAIMEPKYTAGMATSGTSDYPTPSQMSIDGCELTTGEDGEDVLRVKLTVTNNGEEAQMPMSITDGVEAYQDGVSLVWFSTWHLEATEEDEAYEEDLAPGETVQCNALFQLRNDHPVEVVIESLNSELRLGKVFDVKAEMAAQQADKEAQQQAAQQAEAEARKAIVGTWLQRDSDWDDTFIFNADGTGKVISGPEYVYTYSVSGENLTLTYDDGEKEEFTFSVSGDVLTLVDAYGDEAVLDKQTEQGAEPTQPTEQETTAATEPENPYVKEILGTWVDQESGYQETFTFNADGTGTYSFVDGALYEYNITYKFFDGNYLEFYYEDGSTGGFTVRIEGDTLYVTNLSVVDMPLVRQ